MHDPSTLEYQSIVSLWEQWIADRAEIIAPSLLRYEVTNALYRSAAIGIVSETEAIDIVRSLDRLPIKYFDSAALNVSAFRIARTLDLKAAYDAHYLALSQRESAEFFTVDKRLVAAAQASHSFVHYVMDL
jgi:predicted nucleic acid-binding protein